MEQVTFAVVRGATTWLLITELRAVFYRRRLQFPIVSTIRFHIFLTNIIKTIAVSNFLSFGLNCGSRSCLQRIKFKYLVSVNKCFTNGKSVALRCFKMNADESAGHGRITWLKVDEFQSVYFDAFLSGS